mgnify:CR=1 FL=1
MKVSVKQTQRLRNWVEDNEQNEVIIDALKEEVEKLKDCNYEEYSSMVGENKLTKEFEDLKNECGELFDKNKINSEEIKKLEGLREIIRTELGCEPDPTHETILVAIVELKKKAGLGGRVWENPNETEDGEIHGF